MTNTIALREFSRAVPRPRRRPLVWLLRSEPDRQAAAGTFSLLGPSVEDADQVGCLTGPRSVRIGLRRRRQAEVSLLRPFIDEGDRAVGLECVLSRDLAEVLGKLFESADALLLAGRDIRPRSVAGSERNIQHWWATASWGDRPVDQALLDVLMRVGTCADHGRAFSALMGLVPPAPFAVFAAARAFVETSARTYWHLSADSASQRVGRHLRDCLASRSWYGQFTKECGTPFDVYPEAANWAADAANCGILIERPPGYVDAVRQAFAQTPLKGTGTAGYRVMSGVAHAEKWGILAVMQYTLAEDSGDVWEQVHFPLQDAHVAMLAHHVLTMHQLVTNEYRRMFGQRPGLITEWRGHLTTARLLVSPHLKAIKAPRPGAK